MGQGIQVIASYLSRVVRALIILGSLLVFTLVTVVGLRSFWRADQWRIQLLRSEPGACTLRQYYVVTSRGQFAVQLSVYTDSNDRFLGVYDLDDWAGDDFHYFRDVISVTPWHARIFQSANRFGWHYVWSTDHSLYYGGVTSDGELAAPLWPVVLLMLPGLGCLARDRRTLLRHRSMRRGLCGNCGYDLRVSGPLCPECGASRAPINPRSLTGFAAVALASILVAAVLCAAVFSLARQQRQTKDRILTSLKLPQAAEHGSLATVQASLRAGADVNEADSTGITPLATAIAYNTPEVVQCLLDAGASIRAPAVANSAFFTAIYHAADDPAMFRLLLRYYPNLWTRDNRGYTPLQFAVYSGNCEVTRLLLEAGADPDATFESAIGAQHDLTSLQMLTTWFHMKSPTPVALRCALAKLLIAHHADLNARDSLGRTALHNAALFHYDELATLLIDAGADRFVKDNDGNIPVDLLYDSPEIRRLLMPRPPALTRPAR